jgi:hypothetical protein
VQAFTPQIWESTDRLANAEPTARFSWKGFWAWTIIMWCCCPIVGAAGFALFPLAPVIAVVIVRGDQTANREQQKRAIERARTLREFFIAGGYPIPEKIRP